MIQTTRFETIRKSRKIFQFRITPDHRLLPSFYVQLSIFLPHIVIRKDQILPIQRHFPRLQCTFPVQMKHRKMLFILPHKCRIPITVKYHTRCSVFSPQSAKRCCICREQFPVSFPEMIREKSIASRQKIQIRKLHRCFFASAFQCHTVMRIHPAFSLIVIKEHIPMIVIMPPRQTQRVHIFRVHTHQIDFRRKCHQILSKVFRKQCQQLNLFISI